MSVLHLRLKDGRKFSVTVDVGNDWVSAIRTAFNALGAHYPRDLQEIIVDGEPVEQPQAPPVRSCCGG